MVVGRDERDVQVVVVGGGPGGYTAAARAAELGLQVALVEADRLGGTCLQVGCIPSKTLITGAHDHVRAGRLYGEAPRFDLKRLRTFGVGVIATLEDGIRRMLAGATVDVVAGTAVFSEPKELAVDKGDRLELIRFEHAILATGSRPRVLPGMEPDGDRFLDSTGVLALDDVPDRLVVVGAGYIGLELGMAFARLGSQVTVVEATPHLLPGFAAELVAVLERHLADLGITVLRDAPASRDGDRILAGGQALEADRYLVAVGREPCTDALELREAGLEARPDGLLDVDAQCRTAVSHIYAIGDVVDGPPLAHKAVAEGRVAAEAIAGRASARDALVPLIAFTDPELASVGLTLEQAKAASVTARAATSRFSALGRAQTLGEPGGFLQIVHDDAGTALGVHIAGPGASDLIGAATVAVEAGLSVEDLALTIFPHPTLVEALGDAARHAVARAARVT